MASGRKLLIDTNVVIGLEDWREVSPVFAQLQKLCSQHGHRLFIHSSALDDINRDTDSNRRKVTISKFAKFERIDGIRSPPLETLTARYGSINKPNDQVDVALLVALEINAVDFLVTQDQGIHSRARRVSAEFADRVLSVAEAVDWIVADYEPKAVNLPLVEERPAHAIDPNDEMFESLRDGYPDFDRWWRETCVPNHRPCWVVTIADELAGLVVRKPETQEEAQTRHPGPSILKICTFKVKAKFRGEKLGELLLKQVLWFAQRNGFDLVYLTTYPEQAVLIQVLEYFGFSCSGENSAGELVYEKPMLRTALMASDEQSVFDLDRRNYPRFVSTAPAASFCVPIQGRYHQTLFPELADTRQPDLFAQGGILDDQPRTPGNTIRKVYLCRAKTGRLRPGSVLYFYRSSSLPSPLSQSITTVGVVERVSEAIDLDQLARMTAKRSVYSLRQLEAMVDSNSQPIKVIDFLLIGHLSPAMSLSELVAEGVFGTHPPQSITMLNQDQSDAIRSRLRFGFDV